jgi:hypothetical protein
MLEFQSVLVLALHSLELVEIFEVGVQLSVTTCWSDHATR